MLDRYNVGYVRLEAAILAVDRVTAHLCSGPKAFA